MTTDTLDITQRFGSGRSVQRIEDEGLLKGLGQYTDDLAPAGQLRMVFVRSPYPHARITSIDTANAAGMPGVVKVMTGAQLVAAGVKPLPTLPMLPDGSKPATAQRRVTVNLNKFERRGTTARNRAVREAKKARTRLERLVRRNRREVERQVKSARRDVEKQVRTTRREVERQVGSLV